MLPLQLYMFHTIKIVKQRNKVRVASSGSETRSVVTPIHRDIEDLLVRKLVPYPLVVLGMLI